MAQRVKIAANKEELVKNVGKTARATMQNFNMNEKGRKLSQ